MIMILYTAIAIFAVPNSTVLYDSALNAHIQIDSIASIMCYFSYNNSRIWKSNQQIRNHTDSNSNENGSTPDSW
jgi:hypothetical protein